MLLNMLYYKIIRIDVKLSFFFYVYYSINVYQEATKDWTCID